MNENLKIGDWVRVDDPGLNMLMRFAEPGSNPINEARIIGFWDDGKVEVAFPYGDEDIEVHSGASIYSPHELTPIDKPGWYKHD